MTHPRIASSKIAHSLRLKSNTRAGLILTTLLLMVAMTAMPAATQTYTVVYKFAGGTHGSGPGNKLAQGRDGNLYGFAESDGADGYGLLFRISPDGRFSVQHRFSYVDGAYPDGDLTLATDGNFYGATQLGGAYDFGTLFRFTPSRGLITLQSFARTADGQEPMPRAPMQATDGNLYGTTYTGVAYKMTLSGIFTPIASLPGAIGSVDSFIQGADGNFYGITTWGGTWDAGTVFQMTPNGVVTILHEFDGTNGKWPHQLIQARDGHLYGTTEQSGLGVGLAYKLTLQGAFTILQFFTNDTMGENPGSLFEATDGNFYGCTEFGGGVFQLAPTGAVAVQHTFDKVDVPSGVNLAGPLMQHTNGKLYGLIFNGGPLSDGLVYSLDLGLPPFVSLVSTSGKVGTSITILGQGFAGATNVSFNGIPAAFKVWSDTFLKATVPLGATTGPVTVTTSTGTLTSNHPFRVHPVIRGVTPGTGAAGTSVVITGTSFTQTTKVTFGGGKAEATFTVDSDSQVTAIVPAGAPSGYIVLTTAGGRSRSPDAFTVTP